MKTDNQTILRTAKEAQDMEKKALGRFDKDANLTFSGSKDFWEEFLKK